MSLLLPKRRSLLNPTGESRNLVVGSPPDSFRGYNPTGIANLFLWLDATNPKKLGLSGNNVTSWGDMAISGAGDFSVSTPSSAVTKDLSTLSRASIAFANPTALVNTLISSAAASAWYFLTNRTTDFSIAYLCVNKDAGTNRYVFATNKQTTGTGFADRVISSTQHNIGVLTGGSSAGNAFCTGFHKDTYDIVIITYENATNTITAYRNSTSSNSFATTSSVATNDGTALFGLAQDAVNGWTGNLGAFYIWKHLLSTQEISDVVAGLQAYWGVS